MPPARSSPSRASSPSSPDLPEDQPASGYRPRMTDQGNDPTRPIPVTGDDPTRAMPPVPPTPPGPPLEPPLVLRGGEQLDRPPWRIAALLARGVPPPRTPPPLRNVPRHHDDRWARH